MRNQRRQKGIGFIGLAFVVIVVGALVLLGFRVLPAYLQFFTVKSALKEITNNPELKNASLPEIRSAFDKRAMVNDINVITGKDLEVEKGRDGGFTVSQLLPADSPVPERERVHRLLGHELHGREVAPSGTPRRDGTGVRWTSRPPSAESATVFVSRGSCTRR